jgi:hypothetical protein
MTMKNAILITLMIIVSGLKFYSQNISRDQTIVAGEYFTNTDPGTGNGTPICANHGSPVANASFTTQILSGDTLYFRFEGSDGTWSTLQAVLSGTLPASGTKLVAGGYFVDSDPEIGNATSFAIGIIEKVPASLPLLTRADILHMHAMDSFGRWSPPKAAKYDFRKTLDVRCCLKCDNGSMVPVTEMSIADPIPDYVAFVATSTSKSELTNADTVCVRIWSENGFWSAWSQSAGVPTAIQWDNVNIPKDFKLFQAYPNPFSSSMTIDHEIPGRSHISIIVYDVLGKDIRTVINDNKPAAVYWVTFDAGNVPIEVYFYRLVANGVEPSAT